MEAALEHADAALLTTVDPAWRDADWKHLLTRMRTPVLIDGRNVLRNVRLPEAARYYPLARADGCCRGNLNGRRRRSKQVLKQQILSLVRNTTPSPTSVLSLNRDVREFPTRPGIR